MKQIVLILFLVSVTSAQVEEIECPFARPDLVVNSEEECDKVAACVFGAATSGICHMIDNSLAGYTVDSGPIDTGRGFTATLTKIDPSITLFEDDIESLTFELIQHENYHLQIKIYDAQNARYEIPYAVNVPDSPDVDGLYSVSISEVGQPFSFSVTRSSTGTTIFESIGPLSFEDQFIQLTTSLPSDYVYGFGENSHTTFKKDFGTRATYPIFTRDQPPGNHQYNEYGAQPYYVVVEDASGNTHSVLIYNSNAMEYSTFSFSDGTPALTLRTIGGIIDLHFFLGPTPEEVNQQYAIAIGMPTFPPYYALGFHLSRYGYTGVDHVRQVRDRMRAKGIPQDVQTFDIDYMENERDFTYDSAGSWADFPQFVAELHAEDVKTTIILDPAVVIDVDNYEPYNRGRQVDAFMKWLYPEVIPADQESYADDYIVGYVWPNNKTVFPDFFYQPAIDWWIDECQRFHDVIDYDVIWIDMNEPANFGTNMDRPFNYPDSLEDWSLKCPYTILDDPPYPTKATYHAASDSMRISDKTTCLTSLQRDANTNYTHYDVHNLYGLSELYATVSAMEALFPGQKSLIYSRATFPGAGKYVTHWLGDNTASWEQLRWSIIGMLEFNLFAITNVGADVCGFFGEPTENLCARWMQLGAFYPFNRNHNTLGPDDQDPGVDKWPLVNEVSRDVLLLRYKYNPFLYTLFYQSYTFGNSVVRPLWNIFPTDMTAREVDDEFFWGAALLIAPVVEEDAVTRSVYFPEGTYYDLISGDLTATGPATVGVDAPFTYIPVYVRGGAIIPYQEPAVNTVLSRQNPMGFTVALDGTSAYGTLYYDDGISASPPQDQQFIANMTYSNGTFTMDIDQGAGAVAVANLTVESIDIYGYANTPTSVTVNGDPIDTWVFNTNLYLNISLSVPLNQDLLVQIT